MTRLVSPLLLLLLVPATQAAFVQPSSAVAEAAVPRKTALLPRRMTPVDQSLLTDAFAQSNTWLATIDSDIANIPQNEFAPVFAGGIVVMFGGILSAAVVGFILESRNLYANVVADSYAQGGADEEFWKGLSEEERKKAEQILERFQKTQGGDISKNSGMKVVATSLERESSSSSSSSSSTAGTSNDDNDNDQQRPSTKITTNKPTDMFSDYDK